MRDGNSRGVMALQGAIVLNGGIGKRLLNVREAAEYLGLEIDTVYKKARLRELPSVKVGRALRFDVKPLHRAANNRNR
jgi:excisionase family DNA binding protein